MHREVLVSREAGRRERLRVLGFILRFLGRDVQDVRMPRSTGMCESGLPRSRVKNTFVLARCERERKTSR